MNKSQLELLSEEMSKSQLENLIAGIISIRDILENSKNKSGFRKNSKKFKMVMPALCKEKEISQFLMSVINDCEVHFSMKPDLIETLSDHIEVLKIRMAVKKIMEKHKAETEKLRSTATMS